MEARLFLHISNSQGQALFIGPNRLMFGTVVFKDAANIFGQGYAPNIGQKDKQAQDAFNDIEAYRVIGYTGKEFRPKGRNS